MSKKMSLLVLVIMAVLSLIVISGCGSLTEKAVEKASETAAEKAIESASGGAAQVDIKNGQMTINTKEGNMVVGDNSEWPSKIPSQVPKFSYGKITSTLENTTPEGELSIFVTIEGVSLANLEKYQSDLEAGGWKITMTTKMQDAFIAAAEQGQKSVNLSFSTSANEEYTGGITYIEKK